MSNLENFYSGATADPESASDIIALATLKNWTLDDIATECGVGASLQVDLCRRCGRYRLYAEVWRGICRECRDGEAADLAVNRSQRHRSRR